MDKVHGCSLRKHEILRKKLIISHLFMSGQSVKGQFLRLVYASVKRENFKFHEVPAILFTVGKKTVPSAVRRNRVKRMMREAYRLEKHAVAMDLNRLHHDGLNERICIAFLYMGRRKTLPGLLAFREEIRGLIASMVFS